MTATVTVTLRGRSAYFDGPRGLIVRAFDMAGAAWMISLTGRVPCCSITRADDVMVALENGLRARVHLIDETTLFESGAAS